MKPLWIAVAATLLAAAGAILVGRDGPVRRRAIASPLAGQSI